MRCLAITLPTGSPANAGVPSSRRLPARFWWLVARTKIIDDVVIEAIGDGCDKVLNLAAGLDTRPYRLDLPQNFTWVEADLPALLTEKEQALADETPRCRLTRHAVDLADPAARDAFLNDELAGPTNALVLTEGLLMYLEASDVDALSAAFKRPEVAWWMLDFAGPGLRKRMNKRTRGLM
jgi:methyltransferase (TIGR00027 family)